MSGQAIQAMISHWKGEFEKQIQLEKYDTNEYFFSVPPKYRYQFRDDLYPQPFYGYFTDDMSKDIFMPLLNPGPVSKKHVTDQYEGMTYSEANCLWNQVIRERHITGWNKANFHQMEKQYDEKLGTSHWRNKKLKQVKRVVGDVEFLHTIELLPFHSDRWKAGMISQEAWFRNLPSTKLAIDVIEEISCLRLVKHILGIGLPWADILSSYPDKFHLDDHCTLTGAKGRIGHRIFKFMPIKNPEGQPIVIYSGTSMNLPVNMDEAVNTIRRMLGLMDS